MSENEASGGAEAAPSPTQELSALSSDKAFQADFSGSNGRPAQKEAAARKSDLTRVAHGPADEPTPVVPQQVQDGLDATDNVSKAAAEAMIPGASPADYTFTWSNAGEIDRDILQEQNSVAAEGAHAIGASPEYAKATVRALEDMVDRSTGIDPTETDLQEALTRQFSGNADATIAAAKATLAKMPERSRQWALNTATELDADGVAWFVGRLASVHRANTPK
jgi:hypothetical protein